MISREKKPYEKPKLTMVSLDPQCAVLGFCKTSGGRGPTGSNCKVFSSKPCKASGS
jgi:hypothetical protein